MIESSIYQFVRDKLVTHGVNNTDDGSLTLNDKPLFSLFVNLERSKRASDFDSVLSTANEIETHLISINKRQVMVFVYLYLKFSVFTPKLREADEIQANGSVKKSSIFRRDISDEEMLIGLWATVKYGQIGEKYLRVVYATQ